jgi:hypothetical protein
MLKNYCTLSLALFLILSPSSRAIPQMKDYPIEPVNFNNVKVTGKFWASRIETDRTVTIPFAFKKSEETGRIRNFEVAAQVNTKQIQSGKFCSTSGYDDSDVYKIVEGAAYTLSLHYDAKLDRYLDDLIAKFAGAQEPDGYLYTNRTIDPQHTLPMAGNERWVRERRGSHELYNVGHMYEAAVAHFYATSKRTFLNVALKNADLLCATFGPGKKSTASGHQEIEIGLAKLYRVTGEKKYLELARFLLEQRGRLEPRGKVYTQDHLPVTEQTEAVGHAVRANYMYAGMADVGALLGDTTYIHAIKRIWDNVAERKLYITGGIGARSDGEAYGDDYELPNLTAYNETCAAIANVLWNHRMFLLFGESKYIDVLERSLYNGVISGYGFDGKHFFYPNPLASNGGYERSEWFDCACCPSNLARFVASLAGYIYAKRDDNLYVNLFIEGKAQLELQGKKIEIEQKTEYPWNGKVDIHLKQATGAAFNLCVRIPGWARNEPTPGGLYRYAENVETKPLFTVNGKPVTPTIVNGYAVIHRKWNKGDVVQAEFPMNVRTVLARKEVQDDKDLLSLERGPLVYCAEAIDNGGEVSRFVIPTNTKFSATYKKNLLNGVVVLKGRASKLDGDGFSNVIQKKETELTAIPYYAWCHRGAGTMTVWFASERKIHTPAVNPKSSLFLDSINVELQRYAGLATRYTLDGSLPTTTSPLYTKPITISEKTTTVKAAAFDDAGNMSDPTEALYTKTNFSPAQQPPNLKPGISYSYYEDTVQQFPNFSTLQPKKTGVLENFNTMSARERNSFYLFQFDGFVSVPQDGIYTFFISSDDGSRVMIDGTEVVLNDGFHEMVEKEGQVALSKGMHRIVVEYYQGAGPAGLELSYEGMGIVKQKIPNSILFHSNPNR